VKFHSLFTLNNENYGFVFKKLAVYWKLLLNIVEKNNHSQSAQKRAIAH